MEHLRRSFNYTINHLGPHGLPQIGRADWNDCLNLNCFSEEPGESFQTFGPSEGPNAESVFIAGMFVKYGKDYVKSADTRDFATRLIQPKRLLNRWKRPSWMPAGMASGIFVLTTTTSTRLVPRNVRMENLY